MFKVKWEGLPRDYALVAALVALEAVIAGVFAAPFQDASLAYIDPGVGAMVVQAIAAAFFGALFYFKSLRKAIGRFFMKIAGKEPAPEIAASSAAEKK